jgi:hypothetical protein
MCIIDKKLKLCTCSVGSGNKDSKAILKQPFTWTLKKSLGLKVRQEKVKKIEFGSDGSVTEVYEAYENYIVGSIILPSDSLGDLVTAANVLSELNARNCFDFDYKPELNDTLTIRYDSSYFREHYPNDTAFDLSDYMSFVFENGKWIVGRQDMNESTKELNYGKVILKSSNWFRVKFWFKKHFLFY